MYVNKKEQYLLARCIQLLPFGTFNTAAIDAIYNEFNAFITLIKPRSGISPAHGGIIL